MVKVRTVFEKLNPKSLRRATHGGEVLRRCNNCLGIGSNQFENIIVFVFPGILLVCFHFLTLASADPKVLKFYLISLLVLLFRKSPSKCSIYRMIHYFVFGNYMY